jgi:hypothetical protein
MRSKTFMLARGTIPTLANSLPLESARWTEQIKRPVSRQASQPHIEIVTQVVTAETGSRVGFELVIEETKDFGYISKTLWLFELFISAAKQDVLMFWPVPRSLAINHNELNLMSLPLNCPGMVGACAFMLIAVPVRYLLFDKRFLAIRKQAISDTRIY